MRIHENALRAMVATIDRLKELDKDEYVELLSDKPATFFCLDAPDEKFKVILTVNDVDNPYYEVKL